MIEVENISKFYGDTQAVNNVSFKVNKGEILGFLGPNGAGKTTTMRMITGSLAPSQGAAKVDGLDVFDHPMQVKKKIGYLPETPPIYPEMEVSAYLDFTAQIHQVPSKQVKSSRDRAIELCGLQQVSRRVIGNLSKGYRQRVGLAQAILHDPDVLIMDEPTVGLDPKQIIEIRDLIKNLAGRHTVILSTHILPQVTSTCDRVLIINKGEIVVDDSLENLSKKVGDSSKLAVTLSKDDPGIIDQIKKLDGVQDVQPVAADLEDIYLKLMSGM